MACDSGLQITSVFQSVAQVVIGYSAVRCEYNCLAVTLSRSAIIPFGLLCISDVNDGVGAVGVNFQTGLIMCNGFVEISQKRQC